MLRRFFTVLIVVTFTATTALPQEKISNLKFYKVKPGDELGSILIRVRAKEVRKKKLYGPDSLVEKVISLKSNEKIAAQNGNLLFPGDIIYFTDDGVIDSIQSVSDQNNKNKESAVENNQKPGAQEAVAATEEKPEVPVRPSAWSHFSPLLELGRFSLDFGFSNFRIDGVNRANSSDGTLLSDTNINGVISWRPEIRDYLRSRIFYKYQLFTVQPEVNGRDILNDSKSLTTYGMELIYDFSHDFNVMMSYENTENILYRGLTINTYFVDRMSLKDINLGAGYRVWDSDAYDLFLNGVYGKYFPKLDGAYDISHSAKYNINLTLSPARNLSHGFQAQVFFDYQAITAEVTGRQLDYSKTEIGFLVGYFINFSTFEGLK